MTDDDKQAIKEAKGPSWKKVLLWIGIVLVLVTGVTILMVALFRKKSPVAAASDIINQAKQATAKADMEAKIKMAESRAVEDQVVAELKRIQEIDDEEEQAERLAELL